MPKLIQRARTNEAFVVYTLGVPHVNYKWTFVFPCIRKTHRVNIAYQTVRVETDYIQTSDGHQVGLTTFAKFRVDAHSKERIIKAFSNYSDDHSTEATEKPADLTLLITEAISDVQEKLALRISREELIKFNWVFADEVFVTAASQLKDNGIELADLKLDAVKEYSEPEPGEEEVEEKAGNDILFIPDNDANFDHVRIKLKSDGVNIDKPTEREDEVAHDELEKTE